MESNILAAAADFFFKIGLLGKSKCISSTREAVKEAAAIYQ